jgi:hypothetical protein
MPSLHRELPRGAEGVRGVAMSRDCMNDGITTSSNGGFVSVKGLESLLLDGVKEFGEVRRVRCPYRGRSASGGCSGSGTGWRPISSGKDNRLCKHFEASQGATRSPIGHSLNSGGERIASKHSYEIPQFSWSETGGHCPLDRQNDWGSSRVGSPKRCGDEQTLSSSFSVHRCINRIAVRLSPVCQISKSHVPCPMHTIESRHLAQA